MVVLWEKLSRVPRATHPGWEVESGALFLRSSEYVQLCWVNMKGCHAWGLFTESVYVMYMDRRKKRTYHVYQVSFVGCTSIRIAATLGYE
jgi:hypothetical protein